MISLMGLVDSIFPAGGDFGRMAAEEVIYVAIALDEPFAHDLWHVKLNQLYSSFRWLEASGDADELIGVQYLSKSFDILKMCADDDNEIDFVVQKIVETSHTLNGIRIYVDAERLLSYGIDGQVCVWDVNTMEMLNSIVTHGIHSGGVKQAIYAKDSGALQSIGFSGNCVVYGLENGNSWHVSLHDILNRCAQETRLLTGNRRPLSTRSWKSIEVQKASATEAELSIAELASVASELSRIKAKVELLLTANYSIQSSDEKLPTTAFNVNKSGTDRLYELKAKERDAHKQRRIQFQRYQQEILAHIKRCTWDRLRVKPSKVRSIGACDSFIENYTMTELDEKLGNDTNIEQILQMPEVITAINEYRPWIPKTFGRNELELPALRGSAMKSKNFERFTNVASKIIERNLKARATSSHLFITPLATETNEIDIEDSQQVFEHNVRAYVSLSIWALNGRHMIEMYSLRSTTSSNCENISTAFSCVFKRQRKTKWTRYGVGRSDCGKLIAMWHCLHPMRMTRPTIVMNWSISSTQSMNGRTAFSRRTMAVTRARKSRMCRKMVKWIAIFSTRTSCNTNWTK